LRRMRKDRELQLGEAAGRAGMKAANLCRIEHGELGLSEVAAWRLAGLYGRGVFDLVAAGRLLPAVQVAGKREPALDDAGANLSAFILPGDVRVLVPAAMARRLM